MTSTSVTWTKNVENQYEVSTKEHLLQVMNQGSLFTDEGDAPTDYWSSSYVQTGDIDLVGDHASIVPIGNDTTNYTGAYDGGAFKISNWSYNQYGDYVGLFGYAVGATLKNIRLSGVWIINSGKYSGFIVGNCKSSTIYDVEGDFLEGTFLGDGTSDNGSDTFRGTLIGLCVTTSVFGATVRGMVDSVLIPTESNTTYAGGVVGFLASDSSLSMARNLATFPSGISASYAGGITGHLSKTVLSNGLNAMKGDLVGTYTSAGIAGRTFANCEVESVVNAMTGNITGNITGGIIGHVYAIEAAGLTASKMLNYMQGDIGDGTDEREGGLVGQIYKFGSITTDVVIEKSVVAMRGNVKQSVRGDEKFTPSVVEVTVDTSFGMTYDANDYGTATMVVDDALVYHPSFTDLPYFKLEGTDAGGTQYDWDFVYGNIGAKYPKHTHLSVHTTAMVSAPLPTEFSGVDGAQTYLTYAHADNKSLCIDSSLSIVETTAEIAFDYDKSQVLYGTPDPSETLMWTTNDNGEYEVATKEHLIQLMSEGGMYTDMGDHPTNYWSSSFVQTSDIDLVADQASTVPIGNDTTNFTGTYDGGLFEIKNWSFASDPLTYAGLFGCCTNGAVLKRIRLSGVCTISGDYTHAGFACALLQDSEASDIEANFAYGTEMGGGAITNGGSLIGSVSSGSCSYMTVSGSLVIGGEVSQVENAGGLFGSLKSSTTATMCRNSATFPGGITATVNAGGVVGLMWSSTLTKCSNAMAGDLHGLRCGGICACVINTCTVDLLVNSMTGKAVASNYAGGLFGYIYMEDEADLFTATRLLNFMRGDVLGPSGAGGVVGNLYRVSASADVSISKTLVAMQGSVENAVRGSETFVPSVIDVSVDTSFGMFFDGNDYGTMSNVVVDDAFVYHPSFTDLPYFKLDNWEFLFPNIGGKYEKYTHLTAHTAQVTYPLYADFGLDALNDTVYLTFANEDESSLYANASLTVVDTTAAVVFDHAKTQVLFGTPTPATTVLWTKDADGKFEVASKEHMLQLMNQGTLYTDLGVERPTLYWAHHYVQTAEIDLDGHQDQVVCIGDEDTRFTGSFEENGFEVLNWQHTDDDGHTEDHQNLFGVRHTLEWTKNAQGQYQVETDDHLVQIMNQGQSFVDEGDAPAEYWSASALYIQTADIDLSESHSRILPIGTASSPFYGQYDGSSFKISNWEYTQPQDSSSVAATGLFGNATNAEIKRVRLAGVWVLNGSDNASEYIGEGFLCGSAIGSTIYDIEGNFAAGSLLSGGPTTSAPVTHRVGCLVGSVNDSVVSGATLKGTVELKDFGADGNNTYVGGVIGYVVNAGSSLSMIRNTAVFSSGIHGNTSGGVIAYVQMGALSFIQNVMQGNVNGVTHAGGVYGMHVGGGSAEVVVSAMDGSVECTQNSGGIVGCVDVSSTSNILISQALNYMRGDVSSVNSGGVVGLISRSGTGDLSVNNSIVAMQGSVNDAVCGSQTFTPSELSVVVNNEFGINSSSSPSSSAVLSGYTTNTDFPDLPYIPLVGTDPDGVSLQFDFVFANLGGRSVYKGLFTHLSLHTSSVSIPYATEYSGLNDSLVYLTYANADKGHIYVDDFLGILETDADVAFNHAKTAVLLGTASLPLNCEPRAIVIKASVDLAVTPVYRLTYQEKSSEETSAYADVSDAVVRIHGLVPETTYAIRLYAGDTLVEHVLTKTKGNTAESYDVTDFFQPEEGLYDLSQIGDQVPTSVINEIFTTGDVVEVEMGFARKKVMETTFVKKGELVDIEDTEAMLLPFDPSATETQESTMLLSDDTSVTVRLDHESGGISVGGNTYTSGKSFVIDGKKCTVWDI